MEQKKNYLYYLYTLKSSARTDAVLTAMQAFLEHNGYIVTRRLWTLCTDPPRRGPFAKKPLVNTLIAAHPRLSECLEKLEEDNPKSMLCLCNYKQVGCEYVEKGNYREFDRVIFEALCHPPRKNSVALCDYLFDGISLPGICAEPVRLPGEESMTGSFVQFSVECVADLCFPSLTVCIPTDKESAEKSERVLPAAYRELLLSLPLFSVSTSFESCTFDENGTLLDVSHREFAPVKLRQYLKKARTE